MGFLMHFLLRAKKKGVPYTLESPKKFFLPFFFILRICRGIFFAKKKCHFSTPCRYLPKRSRTGVAKMFFQFQAAQSGG